MTDYRYRRFSSGSQSEDEGASPLLYTFFLRTFPSMSKKLLNVYTVLALYCVAWLLLTNICSNDSRHQDAPSFYATLGVPNNASPEEISDAFHKASLEARSMQSDDAEAELSVNERISSISRAYETLMNPEKRREHDALVCSNVKCPAVFVPCGDNEEPRGCCPCQKPLGNRGMYFVSWMKQDQGFWGLLYNWGPVACSVGVVFTATMAWYKTKQIELLRSRATTVAQQRQQLWEERREMDRTLLEQQAQQNDEARERERAERRAARDERRRRKLSDEQALKKKEDNARQRQQEEAAYWAEQKKQHQAEEELARRRRQREQYVRTAEEVSGSSSRGRGYVLGTGSS